MPLVSSLRVLIADDQQTSRLLIRAGLAELGVQHIVMAKDGQEALDCVLKQPSHLVISDYYMPRLDGVELLRAIRAHLPTRKAAFFLLTGANDKEFLKQAQSLGVNNYLKKPVSVPELKRKIEAVFGPLQ